MQLYLKLKDKYLIAKYKCDEIFDDIDSLIKINNSNILDLINQSKAMYTQSDTIIEIVELNLNKQRTLFEEVHSKCRYDSVKKNWLKETGFYVEPKQIQLSKTQSYQYIPIIDTLSSLFRNSEICNLYFESNKEKAKSKQLIKSFNDSVYFSENELFQTESNAIQIVLYVDDFDSANPLGDSRNCNKISGTYFRIGNFDNGYQSLNYVTQTAILCDSKHVKQFGIKKIYQPLLDDLKVLETTGISIQYNNNTVILKGSISFFPADNLAANSIGGFVESFQATLSKKNFDLVFSNNLFTNIFHCERLLPILYCFG